MFYSPTFNIAHKTQRIVHIDFQVHLDEFAEFRVIIVSEAEEFIFRDVGECKGISGVVLW